MKCPKCQYLTYDQGDRCRNCGYDFALSTDLDDFDLPIRTGDEPLGPLTDLTLGVSSPSFGEAAAPLAAEPLPPREDRGLVRHAEASGELPLFRRGGSGDAPLVSPPATPRAPVSVRRSSPARPASRRAKPDEPTLDLEGDGTDGAVEPSRRMPRSASARAADAPVEPLAAPVGARLLGAGIDLTLMGAIDFIVLYLTLVVTDLTLADIGRIPVAPLVVFLALLNGVYVAAFTAAGGQSFGKMAVGIRVVSSEEHAWGDRVTLGQSALRAVMYLLSALPAGLGFAPALIGPDHRALHDRLAHTRVIKV